MTAERRTSARPVRARGVRRRPTARGLAAAALVRIDEGAYANLALPGLLGRSSLDERDRAFATELVYGTTRMRRACDWLVDRHLRGEVDPDVRALLRLGAYQLAFAGTPAHAAVAATAAEAAHRPRPLVNAVLRNVARDLPVEWPALAIELSYPDWIVKRLTDDLGSDAAAAALRVMNRPAIVHEREDGYVQDPASQAVVSFAASLWHGSAPAVDVCAAPGGKATGLAAVAGGRLVVAGDARPSRAALVAANARWLFPSAGPLGGRVAVLAADGRAAPIRPRHAALVLVDAPCSGLAVLRRRPDARWRMTPDRLPGLVALQRALLQAAADLVAPGGAVVYSVCTLTAQETTAQDSWCASALPQLAPVPPPAGAGWTPCGRGARLLPTEDHDGMYVLGLRAPA